MKNERLISTVMSSQQQIVDFMVEHQLRDRYLRIDARPSNKQIVDLGLDLATPARRETLLGLAGRAYHEVAGTPFIRWCSRTNAARRTFHPCSASDVFRSLAIDGVACASPGSLACQTRTSSRFADRLLSGNAQR